MSECRDHSDESLICILWLSIQFRNEHYQNVWSALYVCVSQAWERKVRTFDMTKIFYILMCLKIVGEHSLKFGNLEYDQVLLIRQGIGRLRLFHEKNYISCLVRSWGRKRGSVAWFKIARGLGDRRRPLSRHRKRGWVEASSKCKWQLSVRPPSKTAEFVVWLLNVTWRTERHKLLKKNSGRISSVCPSLFLSLS